MNAVAGIGGIRGRGPTCSTEPVLRGNLPAALVPKARKLLADGRRYRKLEAEYARLVTEQSLDALKKTAGEG